MRKIGVEREGGEKSERMREKIIQSGFYSLRVEGDYR